MAEHDVDAIIDLVAENKPIPTSVRKDIIERTDGIPLFIEEMTKAILEAESEGAANAFGRFGSIFGSRGSGKFARLPDGASRPARLRQGRGADRRSHRAGVLAPPSGGGCGQVGGRPGDSSRPAHRLRVAVPPGRAAAGDIPVQACAGAGRRVWHVAARGATRAARAYRQSAGRPIRRGRKQST